MCKVSVCTCSCTCMYLLDGDSLYFINVSTDPMCRIEYGTKLSYNISFSVSNKSVMTLSSLIGRTRWIWHVFKTDLPWMYDLALSENCICHRSNKMKSRFFFLSASYKKLVIAPSSVVRKGVTPQSTCTKHKSEVKKNRFGFIPNLLTVNGVHFTSNPRGFRSK